MKACLRTEQGRRQGGWKSTRLNLGECLCRRRHSRTLDTASAAGIYSKRKRECWAEILGGGLALDCSGAAACSNPVRADPIVWSGPFDGDGAPAWSERREIVAEQSPVHLASHSSEPIAAVTHRPVSLRFWRAPPARSSDQSLAFDLQFHFGTRGPCPTPTLVGSSNAPLFSSNRSSATSPKHTTSRIAQSPRAAPDPAPARGDVDRFLTSATQPRPAPDFAPPSPFDLSAPHNRQLQQPCLSTWATRAPRASSSASRSRAAMPRRSRTA